MQRHQALLLNLLPQDCSAVGNQTLLQRFVEACEAEGLAASEAEFLAAREALLAVGLVVKGRGRGGATARATGETRPDFDLAAPAITPALTVSPPKSRPAAKSASKPSGASTQAEPQVISYRHPDRRVNNPEVGLVNKDSDPEQPKTAWSYDPHLDPALQLDSARAQAEALLDSALADGAAHDAQQRNEILAWLDHALAGQDMAAMREVVTNLRQRLAKPSQKSPEREALEAIKRMSAPHLQWTGKAERTSFEVDTVSLHVHERIDAMSILSAVSKRQGKKDDKAKAGGFQPGLFEAPFESVPLRTALDFYKHDRGWANRLVAGDSLLVMNSLLKKEGMAGQVQMIYIDPPYGIKYGSNFQPFVGKRDVKDRSDADLTQEPEMIKAFRDTWELGIHSYLTYLRDRLLLARELLNETGSVFVQISDENLHHVREIMDEVLGAENFVSVITFRKTSAVSSPNAKVNVLGSVADYLVWYACDITKIKYRQIYFEKSGDTDNAGVYKWAQEPHGGRVRSKFSSDAARVFRIDNITSSGWSDNLSQPIIYQGAECVTAENRHWATHPHGMQRLSLARRLVLAGKSLGYVRFIDDFPVYPIVNTWDDTGTGSFTDDKTYVVQTGVKALERCLLMTTDPGDLVLDPTCGSGTTAYVAEKWGRRWITCDTSRVAITLAKQRLMTSSFDYYQLRYPHEGLKGGFIYKTVPHVTLKSIANNPEIDSIYDRMHPAIERALGELNLALQSEAPGQPFEVTEGVRKGQKLVVGLKGQELLEWEVPFEFPDSWSASSRAAFDAFHNARQKMQEEMDRSIANNADNETLYDKPEVAKDKLRITGPFTVEAVPFPTVLSLDESNAQGTQMEADAAVARSGATSRQHSWRDELLKTGIRGKGGQMLKFAELEVLPGSVCLHASGHLDSGERVVVSFGPEHGALEQRQVEQALNEAGELFPRPKMIVFCAFTFDPEAAKDIDALKGITALKAQMNTDLLTDDLKKARSSNQSFWLMGQPDVELRQQKDGKWVVEVNGFDYFDTTKGELVSGGKGKIAAWSLDTDYDGRSLFPHQFFFPMAGKDEGWMKLKKNIRAELDESLLKHFTGTVSLPFEAGQNRTVAVKIVDDRGIESLKVMKLASASTVA